MLHRNCNDSGVGLSTLVGVLERDCGLAFWAIRKIRNKLKKRPELVVELLLAFELGGKVTVLDLLRRWDWVD